MKRLIDESTDELTRSLLVAGIEHRPGPGNKARVIVALGAGSALGLFSSNAFAWFGTTAGKLTAVGLTVGVAGAVFIAAPRLVRDDPVRTAQSSSIATDLREREPRDPPFSGSPSAPPARVPAGGARGDEAVTAASASGAVSDPGASPASGSSIHQGSIAESPASESPVSAPGKTATKRVSPWRERRPAARRKVQRPATGAGLDEPTVLAAASPAPVRTSPPAGELEPRGVGQPLADSTAVVPVEKSGDLDSEVKLVDEMHWAARHNDREALGRFVQQYREMFPDGQLKKEVAQFAARLQRSETPR